MGTDIRLKLKNLEIKGDLTMASLGRKWPLQRQDGAIETDVDKLWPYVNRIEDELKNRLAFLIGYTPKDLGEAQTMLRDAETDVAGMVEELVNYGRAILLANILHDSAGFLYLEDC